jgi:hypothetical protein
MFQKTKQFLRSQQHFGKITKVFILRALGLVQVPAVPGLNKSKRSQAQSREALLNAQAGQMPCDGVNVASGAGVVAFK